jgi:hypothetical protein
MNSSGDGSGKKVLSNWQNEILENVQKFATATEINFRRLFTESIAKENKHSLDAENGGHLALNAFCDGLVGITAHLLCTFVGTSTGAQDAATKALSLRFAEFRSAEIKRRLSAAPNSEAKK